MNKKYKVSQNELITSRCILRSPNIEDLNNFYEYASVEGVGETAGWPHHKSIEESKRILQMFIKEDNNYVIEDSLTNQVIGTIGAREIDCKLDSNELYAIELGCVISKDYWGKGIAVEVTEALIQHLFTAHNVDVIILGHFTSNFKSKRVMEKLGVLFYDIVDYHALQLNENFVLKRYLIFKDEEKNKLLRRGELNGMEF